MNVRSRTGHWGLGAVAALCCAAVLGCERGDRNNAAGNNGTTAEQTTQTSQTAPNTVGTAGNGAATENMGGVSVEEVAKNPDRYIGRRVTISGEVKRILGPRALTIGGDGFLFNREMTVISRMDIVPAQGRTAAMPVRPRDIVQVDGVVDQAPVLEIQRRVGWDLDPEIKIELEEVKPVLIADKIVTSPRSGNQTTSAEDNKTRTSAGNEARPNR